jgi:hypothetical protein
MDRSASSRPGSDRPRFSGSDLILDIHRPIMEANSGHFAIQIIIQAGKSQRNPAALRHPMYPDAPR